MPDNSSTDSGAKPALAPLLKWPGGKRWLVRDLVPFLKTETGRYYEPFLGGAAVFLNLRPNSAVLSDMNAELINVYQQVRDNPTRLVGLLGAFKNTATCYYE